MDKKVKEEVRRFLTNRVGDVLNEHPDWTVEDLRKHDTTGLHNEVLKFLYTEPYTNKFYYQLWGKKKLKEVFDQLIKD